MKKLFLTSMTLITLFIVPNLYGAQKLLDYGFEDWGGDIASTPNYPFTSTYATYCAEHAAATEVVSSYNGWTPHTGSYMYLQDDAGNGDEGGPYYPLDPAVPGITQGDVNAHNSIAYGSGLCGDTSFNISTAITTGEIFIRFWARNNGGFASISSGGRCKWIRVWTNGESLDAVYMHLATNSTSPDMYFACTNEAGAWLGDPVTLPNAYDGNWHKYSYYVNWNTAQIYGWYDVDVETLENYTKRWRDSVEGDNDGKIGTSATGPDYFLIQANFSAKLPTEETYHALDDIEVWDGLPIPPDPPTNLRIVE